jgi:hypothetical protein
MFWATIRLKIHMPNSPFTFTLSNPASSACQSHPEQVAKALFASLRPRAGSRQGLKPMTPSEKRARSSAG